MAYNGCGVIVTRSVERHEWGFALIEDGIQVAELEVREKDGVYFACNLESHATAQGLIALLKSVIQTEWDKPFFAIVELKNPRAEELMKLYERIGAVKNSVIMEVL